MAGFKKYNEDTGEVEEGLYEFPFVVRGTPKRARLNTPLQDETVSCFRRQDEADRWIEKNFSEYEKGEYGYASMHVENWNE